MYKKVLELNPDADTTKTIKDAIVQYELSIKQ
jgi:hypothetical protein